MLMVWPSHCVRVGGSLNEKKSQLTNKTANEKKGSKVRKIEKRSHVRNHALESQKKTTKRGPGQSNRQKNKIKMSLVIYIKKKTLTTMPDNPSTVNLACGAGM
jgi:hypothetical protein